MSDWLVHCHLRSRGENSIILQQQTVHVECVRTVATVLQQKMIHVGTYTHIGSACVWQMYNKALTTIY